MGHSEKDCPRVPEENKEGRLGWGRRLKASPRKGFLKEREELDGILATRKTLFVTKEAESVVDRNLCALGGGIIKERGKVDDVSLPRFDGAVVQVVENQPYKASDGECGNALTGIPRLITSGEGVINEGDACVELPIKFSLGVGSKGGRGKKWKKLSRNKAKGLGEGSKEVLQEAVAIKRGRDDDCKMLDVCAGGNKLAVDNSSIGL